MEKIQQKVKPVMEKLGQLAEKFEETWRAVMKAFGVETEESGSLVSQILNTLASVFVTSFDVTCNAVVFATGIIADVLVMIINVATDLISFIQNVFTGNWSAAWNNIADIFGHIFEGIKNVFTDVIDFLSSGLDKILEKAGLASSASANAQGGGEIPGHAIGTSWFSGGKTWIHEKGAEIVDLPTGTRIIPHDESLKQQYRKGLEKGRAQQPQGQTISIAKLADSIVVKEKADIDRLTEQIVFKIQQAAINNMVGAV